MRDNSILTNETINLVCNFLLTNEKPLQKLYILKLEIQLLLLKPIRILDLFEMTSNLMLVRLSMLDSLVMSGKS